MSIKLHIPHAHYDKFKDNMVSYSEEQGEHLHQDLMELSGPTQQKYAGGLLIT